MGLYRAIWGNLGLYGLYTYHIDPPPRFGCVNHPHFRGRVSQLVREAEELEILQKLHACLSKGNGHVDAPGPNMGRDVEMGVQRGS